MSMGSILERLRGLEASKLKFRPIHTGALLKNLHIRYVCAQGLSLSNSAAPRSVAHQAPLSMGILQARILEGVAMSSSRGSS